jgi:hypothetical protein
MCMLYKRLHRAVFDLPVGPAGATSVHIDSVALAKLLAGVARERAPRRRTESFFLRETLDRSIAHGHLSKA